LTHKTYAEHSDPAYNSKTAAGCEADGEPCFTIRAQDKLSAQTVRFWAFLADDVHADPNMVADALRIANKMEQWPNRKVPTP
jgi:hypothetical protein